jgi:hypothetical protein
MKQATRDILNRITEDEETTVIERVGNEDTEKYTVSFQRPKGFFILSLKETYTNINLKLYKLTQPVKIKEFINFQESNCFVYKFSVDSLKNLERGSFFDIL